METVLIAGSTGNIGVSAVLAALKSKRNVLAVVRNEDSAQKLFEHVGTKEGIITVEADVLSDRGVQSVVDQVRAGKLPPFQHVYSAIGGSYPSTPLCELDTVAFRKIMTQNFESNFFAYRATMPYLLEQNDPRSTWTICTGSQGDVGTHAAPALSQGPLFSMANVACRDNADTNVRFNEVYLAFRVEYDASVAQSGATKASEFARVYEEVLSRPEIRSCRIWINTPEDIKGFKFEKKIKD